MNWAFQPLRVLDHSMDAAAAWMPEAARFLATATERDIAEQVHLRVELQHLIRLETSGAVLFLIDTRLLSLADLATVPAWAARVLAVLAGPPGRHRRLQGPARAAAADHPLPAPANTDDPERVRLTLLPVRSYDLCYARWGGNPDRRPVPAGRAGRPGRHGPGLARP